jgi:acetolactate synthase-1/2/3 large subunit
VVPFQVGAVKQGFRMFANSGCASMGYDLPAAIGAAVVADGKRVVCLAGDGSLMMNLQELQTITHHGWPIKIFVLNNSGYSSQRQTQQWFFGRLVGEGPQSGVSFPDFVKLAESFGLESIRADKDNFQTAIEDVLGFDGPILCEVVVDPNQQFSPRLTSRQLPDGTMISSELEDMFPFLDRQELLENLVIPSCGYDNSLRGE